MTNTMLENIASIQFIPEQTPDGDLYAPLPSNHLSQRLVPKIFNDIATLIESTIGGDEPYEISIVGLKSHNVPVILIGSACPDRWECGLTDIDLIFKTHVRQSYPACFANDADRNMPPEPAAVEQADVPPIGSSCGLITNLRHSVSLGGYVHFSSLPKVVCMLTVPPTYKASKGDVISQPSPADKDEKYDAEDAQWAEVLSNDREQKAAVLARRRQLGETFEFGKIMALSNSPSKRGTTGPSTSPTQSTSSSADPNKPSASCSWAVAEITRRTTAQAMLESKPKALPFRTLKPSPIRSLQGELVVSKRGRTTRHTIGTVNGIKSLYRLPRDGQGVRREDYIVLSHPWGGAFAYPGDAGAIVMGYEPGGIETSSREITKPGTPCGMVVAASTSGHVTFIQSLRDVMSSISNEGFGNAVFLTPPSSS